MVEEGRVGSPRPVAGTSLVAVVWLCPFEIDVCISEPSLGAFQGL